ncbi:MAG: hypothetical protein AAFQ66_15110 [Pseudomonadota bacterium]
MSFDPSTLPPSVKSVFNNPYADINVIYWAARKAGITDHDRLTDIIFYKHNMDLLVPGGSKPLRPGMANYAALVKEWAGYKAFVRSLSGGTVPGKSEKWQPYVKSGLAGSQYLDDKTKAWLSKPPTHQVEAGLFVSKKKDDGNALFFLAWKTNAPRKTCKTHNVHADSALHWWFELETSLKTLRSKPADPELRAAMPSLPFGSGSDVGYLGIAAMNEFVNIRMIKHVYNNGQCLQNAKDRAWREVKADAKKNIENVVAILGVAGGAKAGKPASNPTTPQRRTMPNAGGAPAPKAHTTAGNGDSVALQLSKLDSKGFVDQICKIQRGDFGKRGKIQARTSVASGHDLIQGADGSVVGSIRYFSKGTPSPRPEKEKEKELCSE